MHSRRFGLKEHRSQAIRLIGRTYREATAVLVLDRELEVVEATAYSFLELGIRTLCSGWMKRLWTLQEASFALGSTDPRLYFQMRDGPFYPWDYMAGTRFRPAVSDALLASDVISEVRHCIPHFNQYEHLSGDAIFQALHRRSTSKAEDITICAASVFDMDLTPILSAHDAQKRIAAFYGQLRSMPEGILWTHDPDIEKLTIAPFRWAPLRITAIPDQYLYMGTRDITCDDGGLHVRYAGFFVDRGSLCSSDTRYVLVSVSTGKETVYGVISTLLPIREHSKAPRVSSSTSTRLAIILMPHDLAATSDRRFPNAAVVEVEPNTHATNFDFTNGPEIRCTIIDYRHFTTSTSSSSLAVGLEGHGDGVASIHCRRTPDDQQWCIT
ncbi:hypothetical protein C8Q73DRAFT_403074 [Cubamyces lactineus]|nr:hypothetical protein C8Q73DRAFT_403074 [Cubamyces lactineus]